ncbi:MAG TPA: hypothetical protein VFA30_08675 [Gaiellaceae bacterium]|nr:hypothetical protein [Gaiellaceae bacterium]
MKDAIGVFLFVVYVAAVISAAAAVTWVVVRLTPKKTPKPEAPSES